MLSNVRVAGIRKFRWLESSGLPVIRQLEVLDCERNTLLAMGIAGAVRTALIGASAVLVSLPLSCGALAESFDKPDRHTVVDFGPSSYAGRNSGARVKLSCSYYPAFMVKQLDDEGQKGTQWVSVLPIFKGDVPPCRRAHNPAERVITNDGWFFIGAKNQLLFLEASDGEYDGMPFRILDWMNGKTLFQDSVLLASGKIDLEIADAPDGEITLNYLRVVAGDCSIPKGNASCWEQFRQKFGLPLASVPSCTGYRNIGDKEWVVGDPGVPPEEIDIPSANVYPVLVELLPRASIKAVAGPVKCMAQ